MSRIYVKSNNIFFQEIGDEGILLDLNSSKYFRLNYTGSEIWKALDQLTELSQLVEFSRKNFHISYDQALAEISVFINALVSSGFIRETE